MSQTATRLPLSTAAGLALLVASSSNSFAIDERFAVVEDIVLSPTMRGAAQQQTDDGFAAEMAAWEGASDELSADIGWE